MNIDRMEIIKNFVQQVLESFTDKKYQERVWIKAEGPECDSYTESMCAFFDDFEGMFNELRRDYHQYGISKAQYDRLMNLYEKLDDYDPPLNDPEILEDPEWDKLVHLAKEVYDLLLPTVTEKT